MTLITDLKQFICERTDQVLLRCNPGNAGDSLISAGTFYFFETNDIPYRIIRENEIVAKNAVLWYSGGGSFVTYYYPSSCWKWLQQYSITNTCFVLPHTINDIKPLALLPSKTVLICRERESLKLCRQYSSCVTFLHQDMALYLKPEYLGITPIRGNGILNAFRTDKEQKGKRPDDAIDLSQMFQFSTENKQSILDCAGKFLERINEYEIIHTNRLHAAIGGVLLQKQVFLYPNSYYKNHAIYEFTLKDKGVQFCEPPN
jgi:exopolysaccharide biosynthesis predicted pyruvyltransferase EpsI